MITGKPTAFLSGLIITVTGTFLFFILQTCSNSMNKTEEQIRAEFVNDSLEVVLKSMEDSLENSEYVQRSRINNKTVYDFLTGAGIEVSTVSCLLDPNGSDKQKCMFKSGPSLLTIKCIEFNTNRFIRTCDIESITKPEFDPSVQLKTIEPEQQNLNKDSLQ